LHLSGPQQRGRISRLDRGANLVAGDYENDGAADLLVLRAAWLDRDGAHPKSLLHNDGHGVFTDVLESGLGDVHYPSQTAAWADYDNDGDLDLYVGNEWATTTRSLFVVRVIETTQLVS
jgi:hypothetical protein